MVCAAATDDEDTVKDLIFNFFKFKNNLMICVGKAIEYAAGKFAWSLWHCNTIEFAEISNASDHISRRQKTIVSWVYEKGVSWDLLRICDQFVNSLWHPGACPVFLTLRD